MINLEEANLAPEDRKSLNDLRSHLAELIEIVSTTSSPGWARIMRRLEELCDASHEAMIEHGDAPDVILAAKTRRWAQREAMLRDIKVYISSCQIEKDEILKSLDRSVPPDAEQS